MTAVEQAAGKTAGRAGLHWLRTPALLLGRLNGSRHRMGLLAVASFLETIIVPIAIELILVPFMLANRGKVWLIATVTLVGCLAAAMVGYAVGALLFDTVGQWAIDSWGLGDAYAAYGAQFEDHGFWAIVLVGVTPIPFPIAMLAAGAADYSIPLYLLACILARGVRYYGLALLIVAFGPAVERWFRRSRFFRAGFPQDRSGHAVSRAGRHTSD
ncbi:MAG: DedA family protein [Rhodospirillaceae bacterium]|nr:DedA family protein [Rhodospirillaceae bacterium]